MREEKTYLSLLKHWLQTKHTNTDKEQQSLSHFLQKLDDYIRVIHFNELKIPTAPFQFPGSKNYFGLKEMMNSELDFLKATILSKSQEDVIMYSDMPIEEMARRGEDTMRFGPLKPVGLVDQRTGKQAYAVVQLRQDNAAASLYNLSDFRLI